MMIRTFGLSLLSVVLLQAGCAHKSSSNRSYAKKPAADAEEKRIQDNDDGDDGDQDDRDDDQDQAANDAQSNTTNTDDADVVTPDPNATCYKGDATICQIEEAITRKTNELRAQNGREPLVHSPKFSFISRQWSATQGERGDIGHDGFPSQRNSSYAQEFGNTAGMYAENVAYSSQGGADVEGVADMLTTMWANSLGHRVNMLGNYKVIGVGVWKSGDTYYGTQIFGEE